MKGGERKVKWEVKLTFSPHSPRLPLRPSRVARRTPSPMITDENIHVLYTTLHSNTTQMDDIVSSPPETNLKKRSAPEEDHPDQKPLNLKGNQFIMPTPPDTEESSNASPDASINNDEKERAASPAPSSILSSVMDLTPNNTEAATSSSATTVPGSFHAAASNSTSGPPPAKRRKLTPSEKLEAAQLKEAKTREKAEQKALKEEEKARKDEEKARKDEEKAKLQAAKDEDKRLKDEEKRQKAEERVRSDETPRSNLPFHAQFAVKHPV